MGRGSEVCCDMMWRGVAETMDSQTGSVVDSFSVLGKNGTN